MSCLLAFRARPRRTFASWLILAVALLSLAVNMACGGGSSSTPATSSPTPIPPTNITGTPVAFFGMNVNQQTDPAPNIPIASLRMWDDHTAWAETPETSNGSVQTYDFSTTLDVWLQQNATYGNDYLFDLARTPSFAQCAPSDTSCGSGNTSITCFSSDLQYVNSGGPGQCFPPSDVDINGNGADNFWIQWVTAVAQESVKMKSQNFGHIAYYEIWNEPNVPEEWQGTVFQLVRMTQDARCVIIGTGCNSQSTYTQTGIDPSAQILTPAFVNLDSAHDVATWMTNYLSAGGGQYVDVIAFHGYLVPCQTPCPIPGPLLNPPEDFANAFLPDLASAISTQSGKPLFNTEGSWGHVDAITDPQEQVAWVARYVLIQASNNISKFYWYSWDGGPLGLWTADGSGSCTNASGCTNPAGYAYGVLETQWLQAGLTIHACAPQSPGGPVWTCNITRSGGYSALAVWDTSQTCSPCSPYSTFSVPSQFTQYLALQNSDGTPNSSGTPTPLNGATTVNIGAIPILLETGNP